jgi:hypothetical protein
MVMMRNTKNILCALALILGLALVAGCDEDSTSPEANQAPVITSLVADPANILVLSESSVTCIATDEEEDPLTYSWTCTAGTISGSGAAITWTAPASGGACTVTCEVGDGESTTTESVVITVTEPVVPGAMVGVAGGSFSMGDAYAEGNTEELPVHNVVLSNFSISKYELTQSEWAEHMTAPTYSAGSGDLHPVYSVSWFQVLQVLQLPEHRRGVDPLLQHPGLHPARGLAGAAPVLQRSLLCRLERRAV